MRSPHFRFFLDFVSVMVWMWLALGFALNRHWLRPSHFFGAEGIVVDSAIEAVFAMGIGGGAVLWITMLWLWAAKYHSSKAVKAAWLAVILLGLLPGATVYWWSAGRRIEG